MLPVDATSSTDSPTPSNPFSSRKTFSRPDPIILPASALTKTPANDELFSNSQPPSPSPFHPSHTPRKVHVRRASLHPLAATVSFSTVDTSETPGGVIGAVDEKETCGDEERETEGRTVVTRAGTISAASTDSPALEVFGSLSTSPSTQTSSHSSFATSAKPPFFALNAVASTVGAAGTANSNNTWSSPMSTSVSPNGSRNVSPIRTSFSFSDTDNMDCFGLTSTEERERDRFSRFPHPVRSTVRRSHSPSASSTAHMRSVTRRSSLLPKTKSVNRILSLLDDESHPFDTEVARERETNQVMKHERQPSMDTSDNAAGDSNAQQTWTKYLEHQPTPYYSLSKLNPELEIIRLRDQTPSPTMSMSMSSPASPAWQGPARGKRKASDDRFEPYCALKRRAVSPGMVASTTSLPTTPIGANYPASGVGATGIHGPAAAAGTGGSGGNAAARALQTQALAAVTGGKNLINMQGTSGSFSKMSLN